MDYSLEDFVVKCSFVCLLLENGADVGGRGESIEEMLLIRSVKRLIILSEKAEDCVLESECDVDVDR